MLRPFNGERTVFLTKWMLQDQLGGQYSYPGKRQLMTCQIRVVAVVTERKGNNLRDTSEIKQDLKLD